MESDDDDKPLVVSLSSCSASTYGPQGHVLDTDEREFAACDDEPLVVPASASVRVRDSDMQTHTIASCTLDPQRAFATASEVTKCYLQCGGDANPLVYSEPKGYLASKVYFIWDGVQVYAGFTENLHRRIREHDRYICGGAGSTSWKRAGSTSWSIVCVVTRFPERRAARQFESRCHARSCKGLSYNKTLYANTRQAMAGAQIPRDYIRFMLKVLSMERWTPEAEPAATMELTVNWFSSAFRPQQTPAGNHDSYLPAYVTQRTVTEAEKDFILRFRPGESRTQSDSKSTHFKSKRQPHAHRGPAAERL
jgi:predicted GIY-YIG superfamily endonuclease